MNNLVKFLWGVSILFFLLLLVWVYSYLPEQVGLSWDGNGQVTTEIGRGAFFYISLAVFVVSNLILYILGRLLRIIPKGNNSFLSDPEFSLRLDGWLRSFSWMLNICYILLVVYFGLVNNPGSFRYTEYTHVFIYMMPVIILLWLFGLAFLLLRQGQKAGGRRPE